MAFGTTSNIPMNTSAETPYAFFASYEKLSFLNRCYPQPGTVSSIAMLMFARMPFSRLLLFILTPSPSFLMPLNWFKNS